MKKIILSAAILIAGFSAANAQATASQAVTLTLVNSISITLSAATSSFSFANTADFEAGLTNTSAATATVKSNRPWSVTVKAATANFTGSVVTPMPASVLGVRLTGPAAFVPLSTTAAAFTSGAKGSNTFTVDYNANPGFIYDAGTYNMSVVYTATQQ